ncbi:MAG TPA: DUF5924 family protein [Nannocystaceae bacterium]|nr:DUF5924 family protein [Nannocystaceae bacterium]
MNATRRRLLKIGHRLLPWVSLAIGIVGALMMDRGPKRGAIVGVVAIVTWFVLLVVLWLGRLRARSEQEDPRAKLIAGAHMSTLLLTQSAIHLQVYFALPFYYKAWAGTVGHTVFLALVTVAALASLWDPLTERLLTRTRWGVALPAFANFVVLAAVLPGLGLGNGVSLWLAAGAAGLALPVLVVADGLHGRSLAGALAVAIAIALVIPVALALGAARVVPAAPLQLVSIEIGTRQVGRDVADPTDRFRSRPGRMMCATSIFAPLGLRDRLFHVWRKDGVVMDRIELEIRGGREDGFRTWSIKRNFGDDPEGAWSCAVETESGQFLGQRVVTVGES